MADFAMDMINRTVKNRKVKVRGTNEYKLESNIIPNAPPPKSRRHTSKAKQSKRNLQRKSGSRKKTNHSAGRKKKRSKSKKGYEEILYK